MNILLDTQTFLWWDWQSHLLSARALASLQDPANSLMLSVISIWEIQIKAQLGKLQMSATLPVTIRKHQAQGLSLLPLEPAHIYTLETLPFHHKDPFDRMLIAQAITESHPIVSSDPRFRDYAVTVIW